MTTFRCPECGRNWQEGPTRNYTENYLCRRCIEALAREAGELMMVLHPECKVPGCPMNDFYTKLRAAVLLKGGE